MAARHQLVHEMSTDDLVAWLRKEGLSSKDCAILKKENFTAMSLMLLDREECKNIGIKSGGQLLLVKIIQKLEDNPKLVAELDRTQEVPPDAHSEEENTQDNDSKEETHDEEMRPLDTSDRLKMNKLEIPFNMLPLCTGPPYEDLGLVVVDDKREAAAAGAYIPANKIWDKEVLKVFFINTDLLARWKLDVKTILDWAGVWNKNDAIPNFDLTERRDISDIRVEFTEKGGCWSTVGMDACRGKFADKSTMHLNLKGLPRDFQRYLVIHEFGHALGMEHEHQRSDFWDVVGKYIDFDKMTNDRRHGDTKSKAGKAAFGKDWLKKDTRGTTSKYDSESIMHYWFDTTWIKDKKYQNVRNILSDSALRPEEKRYLRGIHDRNNSYAQNPSDTDIEYLTAAYCVDTPMSP